MRRLNAMFQQAARKDKEKYWNEECARAEVAYRKGNMRELYQHVKKTRTITLIPHVSKILFKIIQKRLNTTIERELPEVQAGFRNGRGTRDHIANLRWIMEKAREYQQKLYMCFIDYSKAFDSIDHDKVWKCLKKMGTPLHLVQLIRSLYRNQVTTVRTPYGDTDWFEIGKGTRQGCILSPAAFNMYAEKVMRNAGLEDSSIGMRIRERNINNLRYADDTTLLAENKDLENLILLVKKECENLGCTSMLRKRSCQQQPQQTSVSRSIMKRSKWLLISSSLAPK
ncbi:Hypothetical predicted protein [Octopus vulgaris]|uniref:Reverse transcriptase domain-containing protein n=1 Tax=Octopus vulgaris TaxID=6645 RepID=A0AA36BI86_OCTVU|nr:Hypothetical predicted protein [Octopus vulgaris]